MHIGVKPDRSSRGTTEQAHPKLPVAPQDSLTVQVTKTCELRPGETDRTGRLVRQARPEIPRQMEVRDDMDEGENTDQRLLRALPRPVRVIERSGTTLRSVGNRTAVDRDFWTATSSPLRRR
jgi:hypothetical protein